MGPSARPGDKRRPAARRRWRLALAGGAALVIVAVRAPGGAHDVPHDLAAPVRMDFVPPRPGSYVLHRIMPAPPGRVLDVRGQSQPLSRFTSGKISLVGFIYTSCADARGCPLAYQVFHTVRHRVFERPELRQHVRLVSFSFDPARDTPARMRGYAEGAAGNGVEWAFLTTESIRTLLPILDGFGQDVRLDLDPQGHPTGPLAHVLKVFLLDAHGIVREIYTSAYLFPDVIMNDIETLRLEDADRARPDAGSASRPRSPKDP